ncbi:hypothetical protein HYC85_013267 [Camellia sinensis]|uniref:PAR1 protein n=1 Tax=Camellia sinensis TaxID=4442 RepID=A0A7J7H2X5_CAMSI|nr:hypothetical protein HYC85_013267 [Camellia sinensis]
MASYISSKALAILALALAFCVQGSIGGGIECENLNKDSCAFAVSSSSKRCVLEKTVKRSGEEAYTCRTSEIEADKLKDWIENDQCIEACGLDRTMLGISSDSLLESQFTHKLCSTQCYDSCPNIVDLYFNLAAGEGTFLTHTHNHIQQVYFFPNFVKHKGQMHAGEWLRSKVLDTWHLDLNQKVTTL